MPALDPVRVLLLAGYRNYVSADNAEDAFARIRAITGVKLDAAAFYAAVAECLRDGTIREPVRLEPNSLQCHWRLELTETGVRRARAYLEQ